MDRAYSTIRIKRVSEDERIIEGVATTPAPDRHLDVVEPLGGKFATPLPLLLDHDSRQAVGQVEYARATSAGIEFRARIAKIAEPGSAKDLVDTAWHLVKAKLRASVSIGFRTLPGGTEIMPTGGVRFKSWEWLELSLVSVPAQSEAQIYSAKSVTDAAREIAKQDRRNGRLSERQVRLNTPVGKRGSRPGRVVQLKGPAPSGDRLQPVQLTRKERLEILTLKETMASQRRCKANGNKTIVVKLTAEDLRNARRERF